ncbi:MAG: ATP-grasp domain-containing protein [Lachnospiraceae bacterium]|nr:ATP-grasp domain-containing protein [Lachnospiraceae bacterium]
MQAFIIYYEFEAVKNKGFIDLFTGYGKESGIDFKLLFFDGSVDGFKEKYKDLFLNFRENPLFESEITNHISDGGNTNQNYDNKLLFVLNRTRCYELSRYFEDNNIKVYNSSDLVRIANDKFETFKFLQKKLPDINFTDTDIFEFKNDFDAFKNAIEKFSGRRAVIKCVSGHGGSEVWLVDLEDYNSIIDTFKAISDSNESKKYIIQEFVPSDSMDLRVYVMDGNIYSAVLRKGEGSFKSNFSLGGGFFEYKLSAEEEAYINRFIDALSGENYGFIGIDFLVTSSGELVFNEIEEMVGTRMLYNIGKNDIVKDFLENIVI